MNTLLVLVFLGLCGAAYGWGRTSSRHCEPDPCLNEGRCVSWFFGYICNCGRFWNGRNCERRVTFECDGYRGRGPCHSWFLQYIYGSYFPMEDDTQFIQCSSGQCLVQQCPARFEYDPELRMCVGNPDEDDEGGAIIDGSWSSEGEGEDDVGGGSSGKSGKSSKGSGEDDEGGKSSGKSSKGTKEDDEGGKSSGKSSKKSSGKSSKGEDDTGGATKRKPKKGKE